MEDGGWAMEDGGWRIDDRGSAEFRPTSDAFGSPFNLINSVILDPLSSILYPRSSTLDPLSPIPCPLSMTGAATGQNIGVWNLVFSCEFFSFLGLVVVGRRPVHLEHVLLWSQEQLRLSMTLEAPLHLKRRGLISKRHQVHASVTG